MNSILHIITIDALFTTLFYTIVPFSIGIILAIVITSIRLFFSIDIKIISSIIRGTPLMVQLYFCKFCIPVKLLPWQAGLLAFSINSAIHLVEILRGAIDSIDKGQWEAAQSLIIPRYKLLLDIILPQAIIISLPSLISEMSALLKESAIISIIGETDIMRRAIIIGSVDFQYTLPILTAGCIYFVIFMILKYIALFFSNKICKNS